MAMVYRSSWLQVSLGVFIMKFSHTVFEYYMISKYYDFHQTMTFRIESSTNQSKIPSITNRRVQFLSGELLD